LLKERFPTTLHTVCWGLLLGWIFGLSTGVAATSVRQMGLGVFLNFIVSALLCVPAAVIALFFLQLGDAGPFVLSLLIFPKVHRYCQDLLTESYRMPHVITARAKGLGWPRILCFHVFTSAAPELLALVGVTTSIAFGSAIPVEVICDSPGIGQLAWQAALSRDLPLLVNLTLIVTAITVLVNSFSESCACAFRRKVV
jgi:peptide/nickel transport system permease protein